MGKVSPASTFAQPPMLPGAHPVMWLCLLHLAMQRHPHKVIFWENEQFPSHMMLKHQRLVNQAPTATLNLTINVNIFFPILFPVFFAIRIHYSSPHCTLLSCFYPGVSSWCRWWIRTMGIILISKNKRDREKEMLQAKFLHTKCSSPKGVMKA